MKLTERKQNHVKKARKKNLVLSWKNFWENFIHPASQEIKRPVPQAKIFANKKKRLKKTRKNWQKGSMGLPLPYLRYSRKRTGWSCGKRIGLGVIFTCFCFSSEF